MFGLGKKATKAKKSVQRAKVTEMEIDPKVAEQTHVMPQRFYVAPKKKRTGLIIIIILGIIVLAGLSVAGYFLNESLKKGQLPPPVNQPPININQPPANTNQPSANQNVNINSQVDLNLNTNLNTNVSTSTNTNANFNTNINTNVNLNTNISPQSPSPLPQMPDTDGDGLTAAEEILFGTDPDISDSDGDGYSDGSELLDGYDPTKPQTSLVNSNLVKTYNQPNYSLIYPSSWQVKELGAEKNEVIFQSGSGEFIEVLIILNPQNLSLLDWYQQQFPEVNLSLVNQIKINDLEGLRSFDKLNYYLVSPTDLSQIYLITYNVGNLTQTNFLTTFNVMVKNFRLTP